MVTSREPSSPAGLTGYRYLLAVLVLVVLATGPMVLAVAAGLTALTESPSPDPQPFHQPSDPYSGDHELRVMVDPDRGAEPHDRGGVAFR